MCNNTCAITNGLKISLSEKKNEQVDYLIWTHKVRSALIKQSIWHFRMEIETSIDRINDDREICREDYPVYWLYKCYEELTAALFEIVSEVVSSLMLPHAVEFHCWLSDVCKILFPISVRRIMGACCDNESLALIKMCLEKRFCHCASHNRWKIVSSVSFSDVFIPVFPSCHN